MGSSESWKYIVVCPQCCSLCNFRRPIVTQIEWLVAFAGQMLLGSSLDQARIGSSFGTRMGSCGHRLNQLPPPLLELLWGEGRRWQEACGA